MIKLIKQKLNTSDCDATGQDKQSMHVTPINKNKVFKHQEYCYSISCYIAI